MLAPQQGEREPAGAVRRRGALAQQRGAGELKLVQFGQDRRRRCLRLRLDHRAHAGDQPGIDAVGLGLGADRLGEAPDPGRVQLRTRDVGSVQRLLEGGVIGARRLEDDARDLRADPAQEPPVPGRVVADAEALAVRPAAGVEMVFRDVDADGRLAHLFRCPMLAMRASRLGFRSGLGKDEGRSTSPSAPAGLQSCDPSPRRRRRAATLRRHLHSGQQVPEQQTSRRFAPTGAKPAKKQCAHRAPLLAAKAARGRRPRPCRGARR